MALYTVLGGLQQLVQQGPVMVSAGATQVLYTTATSYPQTGQLFQQQGKSYRRKSVVDQVGS